MYLIENGDLKKSKRFYSFIKKFSEMFGVTYDESRRKGSDANKEYHIQHLRINQDNKKRNLRKL
jgi:hypothetical protein